MCNNVQSGMDVAWTSVQARLYKNVNSLKKSYKRGCSDLTC